MSQREAEQKLKLLQERERQLQERLQKAVRRAALCQRTGKRPHNHHAYILLVTFAASQLNQIDLPPPDQTAPTYGINCKDLTYRRLPTREVQIGNLLLGNFHPIRIQTMTTTDTMDTAATVAQTIRCIEPVRSWCALLRL
jgi:hypothetical protein